MIEFLYAISIVIPVALSTLGGAIGQGLIGKKSVEALNSQPSISSDISKLSIIGIALTETSSIFGVVISIMLILDKTPMQNSYYATLGVVGMALAIGISGFAIGIASSLPAQAACLSLARQPFIKNKILNIMLITQTVIMTPNIFGFLICLLIKNNLATTTNLATGLQLLASGLSIGIGSIGPAIGLSMFAYAACQAIGINKNAFNKIMTFTFVTVAIIETPAIFALLISLTILTTTIQNASVLQGIAMLAAAICMGISTIAPGISAGRTGSTTCKQIAYNVQQYSALSKTTMLALAMIDTFAIYGLLISMMLIFYAAS